MFAKLQNLAILSGFLYWDDGEHKWKTCPLLVDEAYNGGNDLKGGFTFCEVRVRAAAVLYHLNRCQILSTGRDVNVELAPVREAFSAGEAPSIGEVIRQELLALGVSDTDITVMSEPEHNYATLLQLRYLADNIGSLPDLGIITNLYHCPRTVVTIVQNPELAPLGRVPVISAENVLMSHDPRAWSDIVTAAYRSPLMADRMRAELTGIHQLLDGTYRNKHEER